MSVVKPYLRGALRDVAADAGGVINPQLEECILKEFTGISDPYEIPENASVVIKTENQTPEESAQAAHSSSERATHEERFLRVIEALLGGLHVNVA